MSQLFTGEGSWGLLPGQSHEEGSLELVVESKDGSPVVCLHRLAARTRLGQNLEVERGARVEWACPPEILDSPRLVDIVAEHRPAWTEIRAEKPGFHPASEVFLRGVLSGERRELDAALTQGLHIGQAEAGDGSLRLSEAFVPMVASLDAWPQLRRRMDNFESAVRALEQGCRSAAPPRVHSAPSAHERRRALVIVDRSRPETVEKPTLQDYLHWIHHLRMESVRTLQILAAPTTLPTEALTELSSLGTFCRILLGDKVGRSRSRDQSPSHLTVLVQEVENLFIPAAKRLLNFLRESGHDEAR